MTIIEYDPTPLIGLCVMKLSLIYNSIVERNRPTPSIEIFVRSDLKFAFDRKYVNPNPSDKSNTNEHHFLFLQELLTIL
jgi:hypothetical protein